MSSIEKAIRTAKKFSSREIIKPVKPDIDESGKSKKTSHRAISKTKVNRASKRSSRSKNSKRSSRSVPKNNLRIRLDLLRARNEKNNEDKVLDISNYVVGDYSTIKIINRPKTTARKKQFNGYDIYSSDVEKFKLIEKEL